MSWASGCRCGWPLLPPDRRETIVESPKPYRELTLSSVLVGILVGLVLNMGICFAGLQIGFTIVGSTVAAVIGFGILRGILRRGTILEVNIFQTVASGVNTVNAGVIFTVPVLFILGRQAEINYTALILATTAGSILGVVMIIPLRKQIIDFERLRFPEGTAVAAILKSPGAGTKKAMLLGGALIVSVIVSGLTKEWGGFHAVLHEELPFGEMLGLPAGFRFVFALSLLSLGAGYLAGQPGLVVLYGTLLNFWILIPLCIFFGWVPFEWSTFDFWSSDYAAAGAFNGKFAHFTSRHVGIGMILGGAIAGIMVATPALRAALASLRSSPGGGRREEVSGKVLNIGLAAGFILLLFATKLSGGEHLGWGKSVLVALVGCLWLWIAGLVVAQTTGRTDWSPLSGLALIAIAIMMGIMGSGDEFVIPAVTVGASICVATSMCADMMADLKTGYLIGGRPLTQQIAQIATCWIGPGIAVATVILLWQAYAFGPEQAQIQYGRAQAEGRIEQYEARNGTPEKLADGIPDLKAPQAGALQAAIKIVQSGDVPLGKYIAGALIGLVVSLLVSPGIGVMVGLSMYLPFEYMSVFGMGGLLSILVTRLKGARYAEEMGVPIAAGLIVGDALVGVAAAVVKVAGSIV